MPGYSLELILRAMGTIKEFEQSSNVISYASQKDGPSSIVCRLMKWREGRQEGMEGNRRQVARLVKAIGQRGQGEGRGRGRD